MSADPIREPMSEPAPDETPVPPPSTPTDAPPRFESAGSEAVAKAAEVVAQHIAAMQAERAQAIEPPTQDVRDTANFDAAEPSVSAELTSADALPDPAGNAAMAAVAAPEAGPLAVPAPAPVPAEGATPQVRISRRPVAIAWLRRILVFVVGVALFAGGLVLGNSMFLRTRPAPVAGAAIEFSQKPAPVAQEFITALGSGDADAARSALTEGPNKDLIDEFSKFNIKKVTGVDTLGTSVDGTRSATEILLHTVNANGNQFDINLIILVAGNKIEGFR